MNALPRTITAILAAGLWINASEFLRNEWLLKAHWLEHYQSLGLAFPSSPVNGMVWMTWGFVYAGLVFAVSRRHGWAQTTLLCWGLAFVLMWIVLWNLAVLPAGLLPYAIPLSLLESGVAALICHRLAPVSAPESR